MRWQFVSRMYEEGVRSASTDIVLRLKSTTAVMPSSELLNSTQMTAFTDKHSKASTLRPTANQSEWFLGLIHVPPVIFLIVSIGVSPPFPCQVQSDEWECRNLACSWECQVRVVSNSTADILKACEFKCDQRSLELRLLSKQEDGLESLIILRNLSVDTSCQENVWREVWILPWHRRSTYLLYVWTIRRSRQETGQNLWPFQKV